MAEQEQFLRFRLYLLGYLQLFKLFAVRITHANRPISLCVTLLSPSSPILCVIALLVIITYTARKPHFFVSGRETL